MIVNVAIVEDEKNVAELIRSFLNRYAEEKRDVTFNAVWFGNSIDFLSKYNSNYDLVLMDIELPDIDGLTASKRLRNIDEKVSLIFITNMSQYALKGYEVNAFDYIVKPVGYYHLSISLDRVIKHIKSEKTARINVNVKGGLVVLSPMEIKYVEVIKHRIIYYTVKGVYEAYGTLKDKEEILGKAGFVRCNSCYLVNLYYVTGIQDNTVFVDNVGLQISRPKRKSFVNALTNYLGENM